MHNIIIYVARWRQKYLPKRSFIKYTCLWCNKLDMLWPLNKQAKIFFKNIFKNIFYICTWWLKYNYGQINWELTEGVSFLEISASWKQMLGINKKTIFCIDYLPIQSMMYHCSKSSEHLLCSHFSFEFSWTL